MLDSIVKVITGKVKLRGATDGTLIGNVGDKLKVDASVSVSTAAPAFSSKMRTILIPGTVSISSTSVFTSIYSYSGSGYVVGWSLEFSGINVIPRFQIDGESILDTNDLSTWGAVITTSSTTDRRLNGQGLDIASGNVDYSLKYPIKFTTSVTLDAKLSSAGAKNMTNGIIYIQKDS